MTDQNEIRQRINKTYALMLMGKKNRDICQYLTKTYSVCEKTAYNYINKAAALREKDAEEYRENALADHISLLRQLYDKNYTLQDFKECRAVLDQLAKLVGINAPVKTESRLEVKPPIEWIKPKRDEPTE